MPNLRIALAQFDFPVGAVARNEARIAALIAEARDVHRADVVLFPELSLSGYPPEDLLLRPGFLAECAAAMQRIALGVHGIVAIVGWPETAGAVVYNAASVLTEGRVAVTYRKRELPNYAVFDERRYFEVDPDGGSCIFEVKGVAVGILICEDLWFAEPLAGTAKAGAQLVLVPNGSPFERDKHRQRDALLAARVAETGVAVAYLNLVGGQDALVFDGASVLTDGDGQVHPAARAFEENWLVADFDGATRRFSPVRWPADRDESRDALAWRAIVRGTRDYCLKNGFDKVWIGLSGGIDSAVVLAIAVDALGADAVIGVRLPSRYTSDLSNDLADEQAKTAGVRVITIPIEAPFKGFIDALATVFADRPVDATEENLQSRSRGVILMALSNKFGGLVLTTGNKSEYAVGYTTIYGDMCGGYAPIKDLYKTEVFALARWRNEQAGALSSQHVEANSEARAELGLKELPLDRQSGTGNEQAWTIPPAVIERPPSAELRDNQLDQDSLPPYAVLDAILLRHVDEEQSRDEIVHAGFDAAIVDQVLRLVRINEWKRHQAAPGPKVSRRAFGRERRYPITSGWR